MSKIPDQQPVFYNNPEHSWVIGTVIGEPDAKDNYNVKDKDNGGATASYSRSAIYPINNPAILEEDVNDLLLLSELHQSTLLNTLRKRYMSDVVYTYIGPIVIALNPFNYTIPWYRDDYMPNYLVEGPVIQKNKPHSWSVAHNTYYEMVNDKQNQCVLVSGESGAGKTEAVKIVIKYIRGLMGKLSKDAAHKAELEDVNQRVLLASPILEAFGNAKTGRNDNSSRFGKFLQVQFDSNGFIVGSFAINYLLEKTRVVTSGPGERVYHSFYQCAKGKDASSYQLEAPTNYPSLGKTLDNASMEDAEGDDLSYRMTNEAFGITGVTPEVGKDTWHCVAAILHLQRAKYVADGDAAKFEDSSLPYLQASASLFGVPFDDFKTELLQTTSEVRGESFTVKHTVQQCQVMRDSLCQTVYKGVFDNLFEVINAGTSVESKTAYWMGLLDIFGFEDFPVNSFEQLCINLANETLQNHYNSYIFTRDMEECRGEGIDITSVEFVDNTCTCELLIDKKVGIFASLDDECALGKGSDLGFLDKITKDHEKHPSFEKKTLWKDCFAVKHYAGVVKYTVDSFLLKNKDILKDQFKALFREKSSGPVAKISLPAPVDKKGRAPTVSATFVKQIMDLMAMINSTNPHWIRCIKPHPAKKPLHFHGVQSMSQMVSSGIIETVRIRMLGFPVRIKHLAFLARFAVLAKQAGLACSPSNASEGCANILKAAGYDKSLAQIGKTKVFIKSHIYQDIEDKKREAMRGHAVLIQTFSRCVSATIKRRCVLLVQAVKHIQAEVRAWLQASAADREERARKRAELLSLMRNAIENIDADEAAGRNAVIDEWMLSLEEIRARATASFKAAKGKEMLNVTQYEESARAGTEEEEAAQRRALIADFSERWGVLQEMEKRRLEEVKARFASKFVDLEDQETAARKSLQNIEAEEWEKVLAAVRPLLDEIFRKVENIMSRYRRRERKIARLSKLRTEECTRVERQREDSLFLHRQAVENYASAQEQARADELARIADVNEVTARMSRLYEKDARRSTSPGIGDSFAPDVRGGAAVEVLQDGSVKLYDGFEVYQDSWRKRYQDTVGGMGRSPTRRDRSHMDEAPVSPFQSSLSPARSPSGASLPVSPYLQHALNIQRASASRQRVSPRNSNGAYVSPRATGSSPSRPESSGLYPSARAPSFDDPARYPEGTVNYSPSGRAGSQPAALSLRQSASPSSSRGVRSHPQATTFTLYCANGKKQVFEVGPHTTFSSLGRSIASERGSLYPPGDSIMAWGTTQGYLVE